MCASAFILWSYIWPVTVENAEDTGATQKAATMKPIPELWAPNSEAMKAGMMAQFAPRARPGARTRRQDNSGEIVSPKDARSAQDMKITDPARSISTGFGI
jgi:hypothetical protein